MATRRATRWIVGTVVTVLVLAAAALGGVYLWSRTSSATPQRDATGAFSTDPHLSSAFTPAQYGMTSFVPVLGTGNPVGPVSYGSARIMAGATKSGATVLMSVANSGRANWQTSLIGPLIACGAAPVGSQLPCLVKTSTGTAVAAVDVNTGAARWIYEDSLKYINVASTSSGDFLLLGEDFSLTPINTDGVIQSETLLAQPAADKSLTPPTSSCALGNSSIAVPERFTALSKNLWVVSHAGLNRFITPDNNQLIAALPGTLLRDGAGGGDLVAAPPGGCTPAGLIHPGRARVQLLPPNVAVPVPADRTIPALVLRNSRLHSIDWQGPAVGARAYRGLSLSFKGAPRLAQTRHTTVVAGNSQVSAFSKKDGKALWSISERIYSMAIAGDVLLVVTEGGAVKGINLYTGQTLWQADQAALGTITLTTDSSFQVASQTGIFTWKAHPKSTSTPRGGQGVAITQASPGISYTTDTCVRVTKIKGEEKSYLASSQRVKCDMEGAERVVGVLTSTQLARGGQAKDYLAQCVNSAPSTVSALTLTSKLTDQSLSAICIGKPGK